MKLCYRGIPYEVNLPAFEESAPSVAEPKVEKFAGKYRGLNWQFWKTQKAPVQQPTVEVKYRGVTYRAPAFSAM